LNISETREEGGGVNTWLVTEPFTSPPCFSINFIMSSLFSENDPVIAKANPLKSLGGAEWE
jgi:hypothetical protein